MSTRLPACCSAWSPPRRGAPPSLAAGLCRRARRSKRGCASVQRYSCGVAKYNEFAAAEPALAKAKVGSQHRGNAISDFTRDAFDEGSSSHAIKEAATYGGLLELRRRNIETYADRRLEGFASLAS